MASGNEPAGRSPVRPLPAAERGEHWWPVALAILSAFYAKSAKNAVTLGNWCQVALVRV